MTPYNSFCVERRPLLPAGLSSSERNVQLGKMWNALSQAEKDKYKGAVAPMVAKVAPTPSPTQVGPSVPSVPQQQLTAPAGPTSVVPLVPVRGGNVALPDSPVKLAAATSTPLPLGHSHRAAPAPPALPVVAAVMPITSELHVQQQRQLVQQQQLQLQQIQSRPVKDHTAVLESDCAMRHVSLTGSPLVVGAASGAVAGSAASSAMALAAGHAPAQTAAPGGGKAGWVTSPCKLKEMLEPKPEP